MPLRVNAYSVNQVIEDRELDQFQDQRPRSASQAVPKVLESLANNDLAQKAFLSDGGYKISVMDQASPEYEYLMKIAEREGGHKQWVKQGICALILLCVVLMNLLLPTTTQPSLIGID